MAQQSAADSALKGLRSKYAELSRKYGELVARVERGAARHAADRALPASVIAVSFWKGGQPRDANGAFVELERRGGIWTQESSRGANAFATLRGLISAQRKGAHEAVYQHDGRRYRVRISAATRGTRCVLVEDVTLERHLEDELRGMQAVHDELRKLQVVSQFASVVAHDVVATLRAIGYHLDAVKPARAPERAALSNARIALSVASAEVRQLFEASYAGTLQLAPIHIGPIVERAARIVTMDVAQRGTSAVQIVSRVARGLPRVRAAAAELVPAVVGLLRNAVDAMPRGGEVVVDASAKAGRVRVRVMDRGPGVSPRVRAHLFEPFFTTKGDRGHGVGLWLAADAVARCGGTLGVKNRAGRGAIFTVELPAWKH